MDGWMDWLVGKKPFDLERERESEFQFLPK
jgi:hypothetical protein